MCLKVGKDIPLPHTIAIFYPGLLANRHQCMEGDCPTPQLSLGSLQTASTQDDVAEDEYLAEVTLDQAYVAAMQLEMELELENEEEPNITVLNFGNWPSSPVPEAQDHMATTAITSLA